MRIGLDARPLKWPGIGRVVRELLAQLQVVDEENQYFVYYRCRRDIDLNPLRNGNFRARLVPADLYSVTEQVFLPWRMLFDRLDVFHSPSSLTVPLLQPCPTVVTVHDILLSVRPEFLPSRVAAAYYAIMNSWALRSARRLIAVSAFTRDELVAHYPRCASKIDIVPNGVSESFKPVTDSDRINAVKVANGIHGKYILYVGTLKHHKNVPALVKGFLGLPEALRAGIQIVLVAKPDRRFRELDEFVERHSLGPSVVRLSQVDEPTLQALYSGAEFLVVPSLYEGFGLPVLEAMSCGAPLVVSRIPPFIELTNGEALFFDPCDTDELTQVLARMLTDETLRSRLRKAGVERSKQFSWLEAARRTVEIYHQAGANRQPKNCEEWK